MITVTAVEAQSRFGELLDRAQREPVAVTRHGRTVAFVVSAADLPDAAALAQRRADASRWYAQYREAATPTVEAIALTDAQVDALVHELR